MTWPVVK